MGSSGVDVYHLTDKNEVDFIAVVDEHSATVADFLNWKGKQAWYAKSI
jgi:hypothetical protein